MFISFNKICAITHGRQVPQLLERFLAALIDLLLQTKPSTLPTVELIAVQIQHLDFFSDKAAEFIDLNQGTGSRLGLVDWWLPSGLDKPAGNYFVMYSKDSANGSEPQSFKV